ncbi:MAG TPA: hypothetical protein VMR25_18400 [Planctomycetaceae bacterium]|jgi:hypothetical protein|nr:hypothetical protein [Planctomycetaceae bacterium]
MELFSNLSDDQIALLGCATALVSTGSLMCLSYFIGRGRMQRSRSATPERSVAISGMVETNAAEAADRSKRRSAA